MALYYYRDPDEKPAVYHTNQQCDQGQKIEAKNRVDTDTVPPNRRPCEVCERQ